MFNRRSIGASLVAAMTLCVVTATPMHVPLVGEYQDAPTRSAGPARITVRVDQPGIKISPSFYGLMTEEINHAYDGGLYAELLRNRSFADSVSTPVGWAAVGDDTQVSFSLDDGGPVGAPPAVSGPKVSSLRVDVHTASPTHGYGVANGGYWGVPITPNTTYRLRFYLRGVKGKDSPITVALESEGKVYGHVEARTHGGSWQLVSVRLRTGRFPGKHLGSLTFTTSRPGTFWLSQASLFPPTYHHRPNGNRIDLMQTLAGLHPSFLRLPGGNYLEGDTIANRFDWKKTIGDVTQRPGHWGPWGYRSTDGLGLLEFLEWCEDLRMKPLLAVYAGYSLRGEWVKPGVDLAPFVQDALDEIELVSGSPQSKWGSVRARLGHPTPFPLEYVEVGNEDWFDRSGSYPGRFDQFATAIRAQYPQLKLIATAPVSGSTGTSSSNPDLMDDHYYRSAAQMERDWGHYDAYDRTGPRIFVGEWASTEGNPTPNLRAALGDAVWLMGLERNSDLVTMEAYAPLLVNVNPGAAQWGTNLVGYDAASVFVSPSYEVQSLFAEQTGDIELPVEVQVPSSAAPEPIRRGRVGVGSYQTQVECKEVEVTPNGGAPERLDPIVGSSGWQFGRGTWHTDGDALVQTSDMRDARAINEAASGGDYTVHLKAMKLSGREGFMVLFHHQDDRNYWQWNIGGWGNTRAALQRTQDGETQEVGRSEPLSIETGRWYDIRVELMAHRIRCFLDDRLIADEPETLATPPGPVFATASEMRAKGEVLLKVVNVSPDPQDVNVNLAGIASVAKSASACEISGRPDDMNSIAEPSKVSIRSLRLNKIGMRFDHVFPPFSVTVVRFSGIGGLRRSTPSPALSH